MTKLTLHLPFPISTNALWRSNRGRVHPSAAYVAWKAQAGLEWMAQKKGQPKGISGAYKSILILNRDKRGRKDLDNYEKCVWDFCQAHGLVQNDNLCEAKYTRWGSSKEAPLGVKLVLRDA